MVKLFQYAGLMFEGYKNIDDFNMDISDNITNNDMTPLNWSIKEFYKIAEENSCVYDIYKVNGALVIPYNNKLYEFKL